MEEQILAVDLSTEQTLEVNLPEQDNVAQIDVYWQDEVTLDLDASLMYIVSGQQEIQDYVENTSKPEINRYIDEYAKPIVSEVVDQIATPVIDEYFENTVKPSITEFAEEEMAGYAATATAQAGIATEKANEASETAKIVDEKVQEFNQTTEASKNEFVNFAQEKTEEFEQTAITATEQAVGSAERSRIWAEGEQAEVKELGGELSSMGAADLAYAIANAPEDTPIDTSNLFALNIFKGDKGDKGDKGEDGKDGDKLPSQEGNAGKYLTTDGTNPSWQEVNLTNKANVDLSNVSSNIDYVVESYNNGFSWYRIYKSGWLEQGGQSDATGYRTINFLKPFKNELYTTSATAWFGAQMCYVTIGEPRNSTQLQLKPSHTSSLISIFWRACGQGA